MFLASFKAEAEIKTNNSSIGATTNNNLPPPPSNLEKAKKDLEFLKRISLGEVPQNSSLDDVMLGISHVISCYKLYFSPMSTTNDCTGTIKRYLQYKFNRVGNLLRWKNMTLMAAYTRWQITYSKVFFNSYRINSEHFSYPKLIGEYLDWIG